MTTQNTAQKTETKFLSTLTFNAIKIGIASPNADIRALEMSSTPSAVFVRDPNNNESPLRLEDIKEALVIIGESEEEFHEKIKDLIVLAYLMAPEGCQPVLVRTLLDMTDSQNNGYPLVFSHMNLPICDQEERSRKLPFTLNQYLGEKKVETRDCHYILTHPTCDLSFYDEGFPKRAQRIKQQLLDAA